MKEGQDAIYYVTGESRDALLGSPYLEALRARGYEVLLMTDAVDTWAAEAIAEFDGKKLVNAMRADVKLPERPRTSEEGRGGLEGLRGAHRRREEGRSKARSRDVAHVEPPRRLARRASCSRRARCPRTSRR